MTKIRFDRAAGVAAAALLAFAMPAQAANTASNSSSRGTAEATQRADGNNDRRICVRVQLSNSRIARPVCKTAQEWQAAGGVPASER
jgi:hypothetical protein